MKKVIAFLAIALTLVLMSAVCLAGDPYPDTLEEGRFIRVAGHMGSAGYIDRSTLAVELYEPPNYRITVKQVYAIFDEGYCRTHHGTYVGGPYKLTEPETCSFHYNYDTKTVYRYNDYVKAWEAWDNNEFIHAGGYPEIPYAAEIAWCLAYRKPFFGKTTGIDRGMAAPKPYRVISEEFYGRMKRDIPMRMD